MLYPTILALHILAACVTIGIGAYAFYALTRSKDATYRTLALALGSVAGFEVISGTTLAVLSLDISAVYLSTHILAYVGVCFFIETLLFVRMRKLFLPFPTQLAASPVLASLTLFVVAISYGF